MGMLRLSTRRAVAATLSLVVGAGLVGAQAASANTTIGPGPVVAANEFETCGNIWANTADTPKFIVSPQNFDGSYNVTLKLAIKFTSLAGQSPGACLPDTTGGTTILANVKGSGSGELKFSVTGGTFDPAGTCDNSCYTNAVFYNEGPFTAAFFGPDATWTQAVPSITSTYRFRSANSVLVHNSYNSLWPSGGFGTPAFSAFGDISID